MRAARGGSRGWDNGITDKKGARVPSEPILQGSLVVCLQCLHGDPSRSPVWPSVYIRRHEAWHDGQRDGLAVPPAVGPVRVLPLPA